MPEGRGRFRMDRAYATVIVPYQLLLLYFLDLHTHSIFC